jgi:glutamate-ammonia-ligase adenylyltransferase
LSALAERIARCLASTPFAGRAGEVAAALAGSGDGDSGAADLERASDAVLRGLARATAPHAAEGGFAGRRRRLLARLPELDGSWAARRAAELDAEDAREPADVETFLDELRLARGEETLLAAALDFGGLCDFEDASRFLSALAEALVRRALAAAGARGGRDAELAVVAMGKLGGREFTYHSDLDLIFLCAGGADSVSEAARVAQRLIHYLATMTGAGVAYAVDSRLRPSGGQGALVASCDGFEAYQAKDAQTWEHLALVRARTIAGAREPAARAIARAQGHAFAAGPRWPEVDAMRRRVEAERARHDDRAIELKTGPGGLMDVEFLAEGAALERGRLVAGAAPAVPGLLRAAAPGPGTERVVRDYLLLRRVESRMRWCAGRAVERIGRADPRLADVAELVRPGLEARELLARVADARHRIRAAYERVLRAESIDALRR